MPLLTTLHKILAVQTAHEQHQNDSAFTFNHSQLNEGKGSWFVKQGVMCDHSVYMNEFDVESKMVLYSCKLVCRQASLRMTMPVSGGQLYPSRALASSPCCTRVSVAYLSNSSWKTSCNLQDVNNSHRVSLHDNTDKWCVYAWWGYRITPVILH